MQTKYHALEARSKELLLSQSSAVSGASVALSGLGNRLELLVEQLITSYNISERDLEVRIDEIFKLLFVIFCVFANGRMMNFSCYCFTVPMGVNEKEIGDKS